MKQTLMEVLILKHIHVIELGGTISAKGLNRLDYKDYSSGIYKNDDFLAAIPELSSIAKLSFTTLSNISSTKITTQHWVELRNFIVSKLKEEKIDGFVISHGTSTLEETAYFLHLTIPTEKPIVLVGAQRPFTALSSDAHINLIQAVRVACSDESFGKGVLVVLNDEINCAREVTKGSTYRLHTFHSNSHGNLGIIDTDHSVQFYRKPIRKHTIRSEFSHLAIEKLPGVEIIYSYAGASGFLIDAIVKSGKFQGIVVAGTGAGLVSPSELESLQRAIEKGLYVVRSSRVGNGRVVPIKLYESCSFISSDDLLPQKARILLMLSLLKYENYEDIQKVFATH